MNTSKKTQKAMTVEDLARIMAKQLAALQNEMSRRFDAVDKRFDAMDKKFERKIDVLDKKVNILDKKIDAVDYKLDDRFGELESRLIRVEKRLLDITDSQKTVWYVIDKLVCDMNELNKKGVIKIPTK
ncbi:MAG: hypothetical protein WC570_03165 [Patescibacteria group bacterium]